MSDCARCGTTAPAGARFCAACGAVLGEPAEAPGLRKHVVVCFVDIVGSTSLGERLDPESLRGYLRRYFDTVSAVLIRHGASVEKFIGDAVMAVFGVPVAREDDAARALRAAAELHGAVADISASLASEYGLSLRVRVGVNGGEVFVSRHADGQISITGDAVNVAARLEHAAGPSETLVGGTVAALAGPGAQLMPVQPIQVRGKSEPVQVWRLDTTSVAGPAAPSARLVGREDELADLHRIAGRVAQRGESWLVTVLGVAGIGKSRLVTEFLASRDDFAVFEGQCPSFSSGGTFWPVMQVLGQLSDDWQAHVAGLFEPGPEGAQVTERLATAVGDSARQTGLPDIVWAARRLIEELSRDQPIVIVWEDLQWAEPTFIEFLDQLSARLKSVPVLMVCVSRPELLAANPAWGGGRGRVMTMELQPLDSDAVRDLIDELSAAVMAHGGPLGELQVGSATGLARPEPVDLGRLAAVGEGNPLILTKMLELTAADPHMPVAVQTLFEAQLDRLASGDRLFCQSAAAVGRDFWAAAAQFAADRPDISDQTWHEIVERLLKTDVLQPTRARVAGRPAHRFTQALLMETAYLATPKSQRSVLHGRVATWLESMAQLSEGERAELIAFHLERAHALLAEITPDSPDVGYLGGRAAAAALAASSQCLARSDLPSAIRMLAQAQRLLPPGDQRHYEVARQLFDCWMTVGGLGEAALMLDRADQALAGQQVWSLLRPVARATLELRQDPATRHAAAQVADQAIAGLRGLTGPDALIWPYELAALAYVADGQFAEAEQAVRAGLDCARQSGDERTARRMLSGLCELAFWGPAPASEGWAQCESLLPLIESDLQLTAPVLATMAALAAMQGRQDEAAELIAAARQITVDLDLPGAWTLLFQCRGFVLLLAGRPAAAAAELLATAAEFPAGESGTRTICVMSARAALLAGDAAAAASAIGWHPGQDQPPDASDDAHFLGLWYGVAARLEALSSDPAAAGRLAAAAVAFGGDAGNLWSLADALIDQAWVRGRAGDDAAARQALDAARAQFAGKGATACAELATVWAGMADGHRTEGRQ
ncbi:MAG TPA: adenylate/guanylate cyclase domain-containing protein [Streptosporangiaceae bacterium]|nr:adenylate/guanylate cyclase domain-containing protein [Streptosporangiaceae bacterium]